MAERFGVDPDKFLSTLKATAFRVKDGEASNEQLMALLVVSEQYGLNPFTKEIYAFPDKKNGIIPVVSVDGWNRIAQSQESFDGEELKYADGDFTKIDNDAKPCPEYMEVTIYRKDRAHPTTHREYLDECYRARGKYQDGNPMPPSPWQSHTKRMLEWKTRIQARRIAFGFAGIYDQDEAERIIEMGAADVVTEPVKTAPKELPAYDPEVFAKNLPTWMKLISDGTKTAEAIVATVSSKYTLNPEQRKAILATVKPAIANAPTETAPAKSTEVQDWQDEYSQQEEPHADR
jgi:phage recombination protein Bet